MFYTRWPLPGAESLADARERGGFWGRPEDDDDHEGYLTPFEAHVARMERLEALFSGFTYEQIMLGFTVPACEAVDD